MSEPTPVPDLLRSVEDAAARLDDDTGAGPPATVLEATRSDLVGPELLGAMARIEGGDSPTDTRPYLGRAVTATRRKAAAAVAWYVQPALDRVTRFNEALVGQIRTILRRLDVLDTRLDREVAGLRAELAELRARMKDE